MDEVTGKRREPEGIVAKPRQGGVPVAQGRSEAEAIGTGAVTAVGPHHRRRAFGGLTSDQVE